VLVEVADTGVGMPPEVRARALEPFFTTKGDRGTGLGLAQVFGIVRRHDGELDLDSVEGAGTTVRLRLPAGGAVAPVAEERVRRGRSLRVLAVDDEPRLARAAASVLEAVGHVVATATSGEEALARLESEPFDVVVSDLGMGQGINGWELAGRVKAGWPGMRFVLVTGWGAELDPVAAQRRGVDAVVAKPYRPEQLARALAAAGPRSRNGGHASA
jgi:CheY-like chemotaxis protein